MRLAGAQKNLATHVTICQSISGWYIYEGRQWKQPLV